MSAKTNQINPILKKFIKDLVLKNEQIVKDELNNLNKNQADQNSQVVLISPKFFQNMVAYQKFVEHSKIVKDELNNENKDESEEKVGDENFSQNNKNTDDIKKENEKTNTSKEIPSNKSQSLTDEKPKNIEENSNESLNIKEEESISTEKNNNKEENLIVKRYELLHKAKDVFPNSFSYNSFKNQVDHAYENGNLDYVSYALTTFETLNSFKNSPIYAQKLDELSKDSFFSTFAEILPQLSLENSTATPAFSGTENFNTKINEELSSSSQNEQNIIKTDSNEKPQVEIKKPDTSNKIIRDSRDAETMALGLISPSDISKITTRNAVNNINESYEQISSNKDASEEEIASYNQTITNFENVETDIEATYSASGEIINQNTHQNLDIPSTELSDEIQSSILESENETAQAQEEAVQEMIRRISE